MRKKSFKAVVDGRPMHLYAYKSKNKTIVRSREDNRIILQSKKHNTNNIQRLFNEKSEKEQTIKRNGKDITFRLKEVRYREIEKTKLTGGKTMFITRGSALKKSVGQVFISVTFIKGSQKYTAEGGSNSQRLLNIKEEREKAFDEAYKGALSQCPFSPDKAVVNWVHYAYYKKI
jgi:hypothetical protein